MALIGVLLDLIGALLAQEPLLGPRTVLALTGDLLALAPSSVLALTGAVVSLEPRALLDLLALALLAPWTLLAFLDPRACVV